MNVYTSVNGKNQNGAEFIIRIQFEVTVFVSLRTYLCQNVTHRGIYFIRNTGTTLKLAALFLPTNLDLAQHVILLYTIRSRYRYTLL